MLQIQQNADPVPVAHARIVPLDRARTFITLLVVLHHSVLNYIAYGSGDPQRWIGFDLISLFTDSFFMAFMFFISGLFVWQSLSRKGWASYLRGSGRRLGLPFLISIFVLVPIAYYPSFLRYHYPGTTDFNFLHFWWRTLTVGPWPSGPAWFLWVLLAFDAATAAVFRAVPHAVQNLGRVTVARRDRPMLLFVIFLAATAAVYLPMRLAVGDGAWLGYGPVSVQTSRVLLYASYFFCGVIVGSVNLGTGLLALTGKLAQRWQTWLCIAAVSYGLTATLFYVQHHVLTVSSAPPLWWEISDGLMFVIFSAAMAFALPSIFLRFANTTWWVLDRMHDSAYGIFIFHYIFIIWLQYAVYDAALPAGVKFAIVFFGTLSMSWLLTAALRKIPFVARTI